jgi:hypothetical protein
VTVGDAGVLKRNATKYVSVNNACVRNAFKDVAVKSAHLIVSVRNADKDLKVCARNKYEAVAVRIASKL